MASHSIHQFGEMENVKDRIEGNNVGQIQHNTKGPSINLSKPVELKPKAKKIKKTCSDVWLFPYNLGICANGKPRGKCKGCGDTYVASGSKYGTSTLSRHMLKCKALENLKQTKLPKIMFNNLGKLRSRKIDQDIFRNKLALAIIKHDLPFSFVEYDGFRDVFKYSNRDVKLISRNIVTSNVWKFYLNEKENVKNELAKISGRVCLTSDLWTSYSQEGYIYLTIHYVNLNQKLNSKILAFCDMPPPHLGIEIAKMIMELLLE